jgi:hypothetical protein
MIWVSVLVESEFVLGFINWVMMLVYVYVLEIEF